MSAHESVIPRYGAWLAYLTANDREWLRTRHREVAELCAQDSLRPPWFEMYLRWTIAAMDAEDPAAALAEAVRVERGDPQEIGYALQSSTAPVMNGTPATGPRPGIVGEPYMSKPSKGQNDHGR